MTSNEMLKTMLMTAVPLYILRYKDRGTPWKDIQQVALESERVLEKDSEFLINKSKEPGRTANAFNAVAKALAALSFVPGGVDFMGLHFEEKINP